MKKAFLFRNKFYDWHKPSDDARSISSLISTNNFSATFELILHCV